MRTALALVVAALSLLALAGCDPDGDPIIPSPLPSSTPIFASDEEALAAAEEAYGAYLAVSDQILTDGGKEPDRLRSVATDELYSDVIQGFESLAEKGWRQVGATTFDGFVLQAFDPAAEPGSPLIIAYLCVDLSNVDVLDAAGTSVVSPEREDRLSYQASFTLMNPRDESLLVSTDEPWTGDDFCAE